MFLQEVLLEYEETNPDWSNSGSEVLMMDDVRTKLAVAEAALVPPVFTEQESLWLQEMLLEYEETHADWRRRLSDFNAMLTIQAIVEGRASIIVCNTSSAGFVGAASFNTPQNGPQQTAIWPVGAQGPVGPVGPIGPVGPQGPAGTSSYGSGSGAAVLFTQGTPLSVWVIPHNLNSYPAITVIDSSSHQVYGSISYDSLNQVTLTFSGGFSGMASLVS
jgi:hypothetical protein